MYKNHGKSVPVSASQNFLTSRTTIERLLRLTDIAKDDTVLEIGAGKGHITRALAERAAQVVAYEIDSELANKLAPTLPDNVRLHAQDFLRCALPAGAYKVFANIPFFLTTDIVRKLTRSDRAPAAAWLVMEKGAAKRFCGLPRETQMSLFLHPLYDARIVHHLRREDFHPAPRVDCVLLELRRKPAPDLPPRDCPAFARFVQRAQQQGLTALLTRKQIATALRMEGLPPLEAGGDVKYIQWLCLFRCYRKFGGKA